MNGWLLYGFFVICAYISLRAFYDLILLCIKVANRFKQWRKEKIANMAKDKKDNKKSSWEGQRMAVWIAVMAIAVLVIGQIIQVDTAMYTALVLLTGILLMVAWIYDKIAENKSV